jgi:hypothetical protein
LKKISLGDPSMRIALSLLTCLTTAPLLAVSTSYWTHTNEADFAMGKLENVVATNTGDLKLTRAIEPVIKEDPKLATVHALAQGSDGVVYAGTGTSGLLLAIKDGQQSTLADFGEDASVTAVLVEPDGSILAGISGAEGKVFRIRKDAKPVELFAYKGVQYIWSLLRDESGLTYIATGPEGQLFWMTADGAAKVVVDTRQNNLLSLATDGKGSLYVGSDPNGIVYRVNVKTGEAFVVYDATEPEINALLVDEKGNLFVGSSDAAAVFGQVAPVATPGNGGPETPTTAPSIKDEPPPQPKPIDPPTPAPGEPPAIPRDAEPKHMLILADEMEGEVTTAPSEPAPAAPTITPVPEQTGSGTGSAIYRVDPEGFVREVFRQQATLYGMIESHGKLLVATGPAGVVYSVDLAAEETAVIAHTDAKEVTSLLASADGAICLGTSSPGTIAKLSSGFAKEGTFTSQVLDALQVSRFGRLQLTGTLPAGAGLKISTRSGNVSDEEDSGWSNWTEPVAATQYSPITSPSARFLQYRLIFSAAGEISPSVSEVKIAYQQPNQAPVIKSLTATPKLVDPALPNESHSVVTLNWEGEDPNQDKLHYTLSCRVATTGPWIQIKEKLPELVYEWETRNVADGSYQIRVVASDESVNATGEGKTVSRVSEVFVVDNTPPQIGDVKSTIEGKSVNLELRVVDQSTTVAGVEYCLDSSADWQTVLPLDKIPDSPDEAYRFTIPDVSGGSHQVAIRATDARGNQAYQNISVKVDSK